MTMDNLKLSWEKRISMREVATFYEDRIRELDGKFQNLTIQMDEQIARFEEKIKEMSERSKIAIDFISKYENIKELINSEVALKFAQFRDLTRHLSNEYRASAKREVDRAIGAFMEGNFEEAISRKLEIVDLRVALFSLLYNHFPDDFKNAKKLYAGVQKSPDVMLPFVEGYIRAHPDHKERVLQLIKETAHDAEIELAALRLELSGAREAFREELDKIMEDFKNE